MREGGQGAPFIVGKPVTGDYFVNREEELDKLYRLASAVKTNSSSNAGLIYEAENN